MAKYINITKEERQNMIYTEKIENPTRTLGIYPSVPHGFLIFQTISFVRLNILSLPLLWLNI